MKQNPYLSRLGSGWAGVLLAASLTLELARAASTISAGSTNGAAGTAVTLPVQLQSDAKIVAVQYEVLFNGTTLTSAVATRANAISDHLINFSAPSPGKQSVVVYSPTNAQLTNGLLASLVLSIATNAPAGVTSITLTNAILANAQGLRVEPVSLLPGSLTITLALNARLGSIVLSTNGLAQFQITGAAGREYIVQASTNLVNWTSIGTNTVSGGVINSVDSSAKSFAYRFYRVVLKP
jgi:hypothetical protein